MTHCPSCERYMPRDEADVWDSDGPYCGGCMDRTIEKFCKDFVREVLLEDEVPRSAFFAPITTVMKFAAE